MDEFFSELIGSEAYQNQQWNHSYKGEHGPFNIAKLRPEHYVPISSEEVKQTLSARVIPASETELERYLDPWPSIRVLQSQLEALLSRIESRNLRWYRLAISLDEEQYWSDRYEEVPILDHFEEWVAVDSEAAMICMLQLIRD